MVIFSYYLMKTWIFGSQCSYHMDVRMGPGTEKGSPDTAQTWAESSTTHKTTSHGGTPEAWSLKELVVTVTQLLPLRRCQTGGGL